MATMILRASLTEDSFKNLLERDTGRRDIIKALVERVGLKFVAIYFSATKANFMVIVEGDPSKLPALELIYLSSGGYVGLESEVMYDPEEWQKIRDLARKVAPSFEAPNRDEIDRMLLDE